jgi:hypothetical protein
MTDPDENAFPEVPGGSFGLTKREYFAAMAMQGCLASGFETAMINHAKSAIEAADALITALNETDETDETD